MMARNTKPSSSVAGGSIKVVSSTAAPPSQAHHAPAPVRHVVEPKFEPEPEPDHDPDEADYYSDDFDEYDDDEFEAYEEDDAIETHDHAADDLDARVEPLSRTAVAAADAAKARTGSSLNGDAGSTGAVPAAAAGKSPTFRTGPSGKGASTTSAAASARVQNVLKWVTLTYVGATFLDLAPKSEYEVNLLSSARLARAHCEAQAAPDTVDSQAQTDAWDVREVQIQVPDDQERPNVTVSTTSAGADGQAQGRSKKKSKKGGDASASTSVAISARLTRFVADATLVLEKLLDESTGAAEQIVDMHAGLTPTKEKPVLPGHCVTLIQPAGVSADVLAVVYRSVEGDPSIEPPRSVIHLVHAHTLAQPRSVLTCFGDVTTVTACPTPRHRNLVVAGTDDGVLYVWDVASRNGSGPIAASYGVVGLGAGSAFTTPDPDEDSLEHDHDEVVASAGHQARVVAIQVLESDEVVSVDEDGWVCTWIWAPLAPTVVAAAQTDATRGLIPGTKFRAYPLTSRADARTSVPTVLTAAIPDPWAASFGGGMWVATSAGEIFRTAAAWATSGIHGGGPSAVFTARYWPTCLATDDNVTKPANAGKDADATTGARLLVGFASGHVAVYSVGTATSPASLPPRRVPTAFWSFTGDDNDADGKSAAPTAVLAVAWVSHSVIAAVMADRAVVIGRLHGLGVLESIHRMEIPLAATSTPRHGGRNWASALSRSWLLAAGPAATRQGAEERLTSYRLVV